MRARRNPRPRGSGNRDFIHKLPGHDYRQPNADMRETRRLKLEAGGSSAAGGALTRRVGAITGFLITQGLKDVAGFQALRVENAL